jgi:hypothetical protein
MTTYDLLYDYLRKQAASSVEMTFTDVERVIGQSLPKTARARSQWWVNETNPKSRHVQCHAWRDAGYDAEVDLVAQTVIFRKRAG